MVELAQRIFCYVISFGYVLLENLELELQVHYSIIFSIFKCFSRGGLESYFYL